MDRSTFSQLLARRFYPVLRSEGFKGSGTTLRRINGPVLHVFNLQGSANSREFYINLGASLIPLSMHGVTEDNASNAKEYQCVFRQRLDRIDQSSRRWFYGESERDALETISELVATWETKGRKWFDSYSSYPTDFRRLVDEADYPAEHPAHVLTLARIAKLLGDEAKCVSIAREALPNVSSQATILRNELAALADSSRED